MSGSIGRQTQHRLLRKFRVRSQDVGNVPANVADGDGSRHRNGNVTVVAVSRAAHQLAHHLRGTDGAVALAHDIHRGTETVIPQQPRLNQQRCGGSISVYRQILGGSFVAQQTGIAGSRWVDHHNIANIQRTGVVGDQSRGFAGLLLLRRGEIDPRGA